jgi:hypothetical protein
MINRTVLLVLIVGLLVMAAVVFYGLSLSDDDVVSRFNAAASAATAVGGFLAFVVLVIYTVQTYRLRIATEKVQEDQVKLNLFDKRFLVYVSLHRFLNSLYELGKTHQATKLLQDTNQAKFLFKPDIEEFLLDVYRKASHLESFNEQEARASSRGMQPRLEPDNVRQDHDWLISEAPKLARQKFEVYLRLYEDEV